MPPFAGLAGSAVRSIGAGRAGVLRSASKQALRTPHYRARGGCSRSAGRRAAADGAGLAAKTLHCARRSARCRLACSGGSAVPSQPHGRASAGFAVQCRGRNRPTRPLRAVVSPYIQYIYIHRNMLHRDATPCTVVQRAILLTRGEAWRGPTPCSPSLPGLPGGPSLPSLPLSPFAPGRPGVPGIPGVPSAPSTPGLPIAQPPTVPANPAREKAASGP